MNKITEEEIVDFLVSNISEKTGDVDLEKIREKILEFLDRRELTTLITLINSLNHITKQDFENFNIIRKTADDSADIGF